MADLKDCTTNFFPELCGVNVVLDPQGQITSDDDRILIIGQSTGTAAQGSAYPVMESSRAALFGLDSNLNRMIDDLRDSCPTAEVWAYPVAPVGSAGTADIVVSGVDTAISSGIVYLMVNGRIYQTFYDPTVDTNDTLAARLAATITDASLTVAVAADTITITTNGLGEVDGFLSVLTSYDRRPDLVSSSEISLAVTVTDAVGVPDLSGLPSIPEGFEFVVNPYADTASLDAVAQYACGQWSGGVNSRAYGVFYADVPEAVVIGQTTNNALISLMAQRGGITPPYLETAAYGCIAYRNLNCQADNIAASLTGTVMDAMLAPQTADAFTSAEAADLVEAGIGYFNILRNNDVVIGRAVTTYTVAGNGTLDIALRDVNKPAMLACVSRFFREQMTARFTGYSFRRDGIVGGTGARVATPAAIRNYIISLATRLSDRNLIQNLPGFIESLSVSQSQDNDCITISATPELVDQFCCSIVSLRTV